VGKQQRHDVSKVNPPWLLFFFQHVISSEFIKKDLANFAKEHPQIEIIVQPRPAHHPIVRGIYCNDFLHICI
jgi:hypothetical protein